MDNISSVAAWILGIILCLTAVGVAWALVRGSYTKARMEALRTSLDDTDKELEREKGRRERLEDKVLHLSRENNTLRELVLQRAEFDRIEAAVIEHRAAAEKHWERMETKTDQLVAMIRESDKP